jgi:hypothetical protein
LIGFGVLLLVAAPFYYRWGKRPSENEWEWQRKMKMYQGAVLYVAVGIFLIVTDVLLA